MRKNQKYKYISITIIALLVTMMLPVTVFANSSWHWISRTRPTDILPFVILGTLTVETLAINFIPKIENLKKVFAIVAVANLASFLMPYVGAMFDELYTLTKMLEHTPFYITGGVFLFMTLVVETPVVYFTLKKSTDSNKQKHLLLITTIAINILTTIAVAIVERTLCYGEW